MALLSILMIIAVLANPFDKKNIKNACKFKIMPPKYETDGNKKKAKFNIIVEKRHKYFINFPLLFKFYSFNKFKALVNITYVIPGDDSIQELLHKSMEFTDKVKEHTVYITDVILGKITIEVCLEVEYGKPIVMFEIMQNSTCELTKEHKIELKFPEK